MGRFPAELGPEFSAGEAAMLGALQDYDRWDAGYSKQQSTRPQTLGYGLADSPSGQAMWIYEKFWKWMDCNGDPLSVVDADEILDNIMLYWLSNSAGSSARIYWESFGAKRRRNQPVTVPTGVAVFPKEIVPPVRAWMQAGYTDIRHWHVMDKGGHFAAFEVPELYVDDIRRCFAQFR